MDRKNLLHEIELLVNNQDDLDLVINKITQKIGVFYGADRVVFSKYDKKNSVFLSVNPFYEYRSSEEIKSFIGMSIESQGNIKYKNKIMDRNDVLYFHDIKKAAIESVSENPTMQDHKNELDFIEFFNIKAAIGGSFIDKNEILGIFVIHFSKIIPVPTEEDIELIKQLAKIISPLFKSQDLSRFPSFDQSIAKSIGLIPAIVYNKLLKEYKKIELFNNLNKNKFAKIKIYQIKNDTYLSNPEIRMALEKLYEFSFIDIANFKGDNVENVEFKILTDKKHTNNIQNKTTEKKIQNLFNNYIKCFNYSDDEFFKLTDIISFKAFCFNFDLDIEFHSLIKSVLVNISENKPKETYIGKDLLFVIFQTLYMFIKEHKLSLSQMIDLLDEKNSSVKPINNTNILCIDNKTRTLLSTFWLILIYRISKLKLNSVDNKIYLQIMKKIQNI